MSYNMNATCKLVMEEKAAVVSMKVTEALDSSFRKDKLPSVVNRLCHLLSDFKRKIFIIKAPRATL